MNTTYLILLILLLIYIPFFIYVKKSQTMKERGIVTYGPFVMFKTKRGIEYLDKAAKYKKFWRYFGTLSKILAVFLMAMIMFIIIFDLLLLPLMMDTRGLGVEYVLALPGINPMLPLIPSLIGLIVAVAIHEIAHGIQTRANDMKVESTGILYAVVPVGAFVEPNEEQIQKAGRKARTDMFAAGIGINTIIALFVFLIMAFGLMGSIAPAHEQDAGVTGVYSGSPADVAGIRYSDLILKVDSNEVSFESLNNMEFSGILNDPATMYTVTYLSSNGPAYSEMYMGVYIIGIAKDSPASRAGIPKNSFLISIDGLSVTGMQSFKDVMTMVSPGDNVIVEFKTFDSDSRELTYGSETVELGDRDGNAFLGVNYSLSGFALTTPDEILAMAKDPFYNADSLWDVPTAALSYIGRPFSGFDPIPTELRWWYSSSFMSDGMFWTVLQVTFWIFWLNLVLAVTNALPAAPFDGGYLFRDGVGAIVDKTKKNSTQEQRDKLTNGISSVVSYVMLFSLILVMMAMIF
jgi:membrane-associated protease RseP (regulator of RpoE activity)